MININTLYLIAKVLSRLNVPRPKFRPKAAGGDSSVPNYGKGIGFGRKQNRRNHTNDNTDYNIIDYTIHEQDSDADDVFQTLCPQSQVSRKPYQETISTTTNEVPTQAEQTRRMNSFGPRYRFRDLFLGDFSFNDDGER